VYANSVTCLLVSISEPLISCMDLQDLTYIVLAVSVAGCVCQVLLCFTVIYLLVHLKRVQKKLQRLSQVETILVTVTATNLCTWENYIYCLSERSMHPVSRSPCCIVIRILHYQHSLELQKKAWDKIIEVKVQRGATWKQTTTDLMLSSMNKLIVTESTVNSHTVPER
jgi:hypothetical protein